MRYLFESGANIIVLPDEIKNLSELLNIASKFPTQFCMGLNEFFELSRMNSNFYLSGTIVFYIGDAPELASKLLNTTFGKDYNRIYIVNDDYYIPSRDKNISELVNGACKYDYIIKKELA